MRYVYCYTCTYSVHHVYHTRARLRKTVYNQILILGCNCIQLSLCVDHYLFSNTGAVFKERRAENCPETRGRPYRQLQGLWQCHYNYLFNLYIACLFSYSVVYEIDSLIS